MKILLTAGGFLGDQLISLLTAQGYEVEIMGRERDVREPRSYDGIKCDLVVHNASIVSSVEGLKNPLETYDVNIMGTVGVLEYCRKNRTPIIFLSSCKVQPNTRGALGSYGVSKVAGELIVEDYWKVYGVPYVMLRPASIYGFSQNGVSILGWITWFIKALVHDYQVNIEDTGLQERDSIHVLDLASLILKIIPTFYEGANKIYEVGGGEKEAISILDLVNYLEEKSGKKMKLNFVPARRGDPYSLIMDSEKTMRTWDWKPEYTIWEGVDEIYDIYSKNPDLYDKK